MRLRILKNMIKKKPLKYIFVVGGVMSGVGKGVATSSIANILQARGLKVTALKIDPYINVDAGTMNPTEHGEVFVLEDGMECDQDMGNYERFLNTSLTKANYMTTGSIYLAMIQKERNLEYKGKCVEVVPHIPLEVIERINVAAKKSEADVAIIEIGGTVGEYQNMLFLETVRILRQKHRGDVALVLVSLLPALGAGGTELKTKPTQHAVRNLNAAGLQPDIILGRANVPLDEKRKKHLEFMCNLDEGDVISAPDVAHIYQVPINFEREGLSTKLLAKLKLKAKKRNGAEWRALVKRINACKNPVQIGIVGKYFSTGNFVLADSYISVIEAIKHAAYAAGRKPVIEWLNAEELEGEKKQEKLEKLKTYDGILVPGGFGDRGIEGKINAIQFCREQKIPYFGLCYGMQLAIIEFARHVARLANAHTTEINSETPHPVIDILPEQKKKLEKRDYGATMRLGAYPAVLKPDTTAHEAYGAEKISERHRHRYEVNPAYIEQLESKGLIFSGVSPDHKLMEIVELPKNIHPFFLGTQFHPEFQSRPLTPHPLFIAFVRAAAVR